MKTHEQLSPYELEIIKLISEGKLDSHRASLLNKRNHFRIRFIQTLEILERLEIIVRFNNEFTVNLSNKTYQYYFSSINFYTK